MRILGIDPGFKATGYGVIDSDRQKIKLIETGTINSKSREHIQYQLKRIYASLNDIITNFKPDVLVLEKLYTHQKYPTTAGILGHVRGVPVMLCAQRNIELVEHSVKRIRKAITGNGGATKHQTRRVVAHLLNIDGEQLTLDASDALALAIGYVFMNKVCV